MSKAVIGIANDNLESDLRSMLEEMQDIEVAAVAKDSGQLIEYVQRFEPDVILLHDGLGPEPAASIIRDLTVRRPAAAVVQLSPERSNTTVIRALEAGARGVVAYPFAFEDFAARVNDALDWAAQMQSILVGAAALARAERGRAIAMAGAKGGVGVTSMTLHLATQHRQASPSAKVCVVDLDLEKGDISSLLDVRQAVSIADLAKVYQDLSVSTVRDALIEHESGIYLLLAPVDVRETEFVTPDALRAIIALLRREFDLVLLDCGGYVSPIQGAALELADETIVLTTPDVLSVRALRKRILAWEALGVRQEGELMVLLNKVDKASIFPAAAVAKLTTANVIEAQVPLSTRILEPAVNERDPRAVSDLNWWKLMGRICQQVGITPAQPTPAPAVIDATPQAKKRPRKGRHLVPAGGERGGSTLETVGAWALVITSGFLLWQVAVTGVGFFWLGQAATEATRSYSVKHSASQAQMAARSTIPSPFQEGVTVAASGDSVHVTLQLPANTALITTFKSQQQVIQEPS